MVPAAALDVVVESKRFIVLILCSTLASSCLFTGHNFGSNCRRHAQQPRECLLNVHISDVAKQLTATINSNSRQTESLSHFLDLC